MVTIFKVEELDGKERPPSIKIFEQFVPGEDLDLSAVFNAINKKKRKERAPKVKA